MRYTGYTHVLLKGTSGIHRNVRDYTSFLGAANGIALPGDRILVLMGYGVGIPKLKQDNPEPWL